MHELIQLHDSLFEGPQLEQGSKMLKAFPNKIIGSISRKNSKDSEDSREVFTKLDSTCLRVAHCLSSAKCLDFLFSSNPTDFGRLLSFCAKALFKRSMQVKRANKCEFVASYEMNQEEILNAITETEMPKSQKANDARAFSLSSSASESVKPKWQDMAGQWQQCGFLIRDSMVQYWLHIFQCFSYICAIFINSRVNFQKILCNRCTYYVCFYLVPRSWTPGQLFLTFRASLRAVFVQVAGTFPYGLISVCDLFLQIQGRLSSSAGMPAPGIS